MGLSWMTLFSASLRTNLGSAGGNSGEGDAAVLGEVGLARSLGRSGERAAESLVLFLLVAKSMTGVGSAWNVVSASESSPSCERIRPSASAS